MFETMHIIGLALMFFVVLPELDVVKGAMLTNSVCFIPSVLCKLILPIFIFLCLLFCFWISFHPSMMI